MTHPRAEERPDGSWKCLDCGEEYPSVFLVCSCGHFAMTEDEYKEWLHSAWTCPECGRQWPDKLFACSCQTAKHNYVPYRRGANEGERSA